MNNDERFLSSKRAGRTYYWHRKKSYTKPQIYRIAKDLQKISSRHANSNSNSNQKNTNTAELRFQDARIDDMGGPFRFEAIHEYPYKYQSCFTRNPKYMAYVQCALIIIKHHVGITVKCTDSSVEWNSHTDMNNDWEASRRRCQLYLGYGMDFVLDGNIDDMDRKFRNRRLALKKYNTTHHNIQRKIKQEVIQVART